MPKTNISPNQRYNVDEIGISTVHLTNQPGLLQWPLQFLILKKTGIYPMNCNIFTDEEFLTADIFNIPHPNL